jgi:Flp pilus assembly protein TadD
MPQSQPVFNTKSLSNPASEERIAQSAMQAGDVQLATTVYSRMVQNDPRSVPGLTGLGDTLYAAGDMTRAGVYYDRALAIEPRTVSALVGSARVAIQTRRFDDAIATYRKALAIEPNQPLVEAGLGAALDMKGDHAGAQTWLRGALQANPGDPGLSINLGLSLVMSGHPQEGANVLLDVTRFPAAPPQAFHDLALAYGLLGDKDAAAKILSRDLPKTSVDNDLRYYDLQRSSMSGADRASLQLPAVSVAPVVSRPAAASTLDASHERSPRPPGGDLLSQTRGQPSPQ